MSRTPIVTALTIFAFLVHGYHPYGEDGGLYIAGIKKLLNPGLYPHWTAFVTEHLRFSLFAPLVAGLVRTSHLGLEPLLLLLYVAGIWSTLYAGWMLLDRVRATPAGCAGGVVLLACWLDLPIAGTSQMLMDPYVTARTLTTPLTLLAAAWALDFIETRRNGWVCAAALLLAASMHPLMAGYALATVAILLCVGSGSEQVRRYGPWTLLAFALLLATVLQLHAPFESSNYVWVAMTRYYWFPYRWEWYEQVGLIAPLLLLVILARSFPLLHPPAPSTLLSGVPSIVLEPTLQNPRSALQTLIRSTLLLAGIALAIAMVFSRAHLATHLVARMQPLRTYAFVYAVMTLLLGAWLGERVLRAKPWRWMLLLAAFGTLMFYVQRSTYPASAHLELPGRAPRNPYVQAFLWTRGHTPQDALFALDAHYITRDGEDAQPFRAIAERSALADYSKDGGEASITPGLVPAWVKAQAVQTGLDHATDADRMAKLQPLAVQWIVLESASRTNWNCPYRNATAKVCQLP